MKLEAEFEGLPEKTKREVKVLNTAVANAVGFNLFLATFNNLYVRDCCIDKIRDEQSRRGIYVLVLDLSTISDRAILTEVRAHIDKRSVNDRDRLAIMAVGLEKCVGVDRSSDGIRALEVANLQRDKFPESCPCPLVFWLTPEATSHFARAAPDLWHWRSATFEVVDVARPIVPASTLFERREPANLDRIQDLTRELEREQSSERRETPRSKASRMRLHVRLADALRDAGREYKALSLYQLAMEAAGELGDEEERAFIVGRIAQLLQNTSARLRQEADRDGTNRISLLQQSQAEQDAALDLMSNALVISERVKNHPDTARILHQIGVLTHHRGDLNAALDLYQKALAIFDHLGDRTGVADIYAQIGDLYYDRQEYDAALALYQKALALSKHLFDRTRLAVLYARLGSASLAKRNYDASLNWYEIASKEFKSLDDDINLAYAYKQLGYTSSLRLDYTNALKWYYKELDIHDRLGHRTDALCTLDQLGYITFLLTLEHDRYTWLA